MAVNYLAIERNGQYLMDHVLFQRKDDGVIVFEEVLEMSYNEITAYEDIDAFVVCVMDMTNNYSGGDDDQTVLTLIDENDVFIWSIIIGPGNTKDEVRYSFVDWRKDDKLYRYEKN